MKALALACLEQYSTPCQVLKMALELQIFEAEFGFWLAFYKQDFCFFGLVSANCFCYPRPCFLAS